MRMRKKKNLDVRLARCAPVMVDDPRAWRADGMSCSATITPSAWKSAAARAASSWRPPGATRT